MTRGLPAPCPADVENQRQSAFFDRHVLSGRTYRTRSGDVIPAELQYYNGEMLHVYGECRDVAEVNRSLAGSGYTAATLAHADGTRTAAAQLWASRFTDTSIGPYNAMFMVVVVLPDDGAGQPSLNAHPNGASSVLMMLDGTLNTSARIYTNRRRLFLVRLLDTTQVAIDVGRERMGTDKRYGAVELDRDGDRVHLAIADREGQPVAGGTVHVAGDARAYAAELGRAAATAGVQLASFPEGTEYVYPAAARIAPAAPVLWEWRSDTPPWLGAVPPDAVTFDRRSEEGRLFLAWGFTPRAAGYIPKVRGVISGLAPVAQEAPTIIAERKQGARRVTLTLAARTTRQPRAVTALPSPRSTAPATRPGQDASAQQVGTFPSTAVRAPRWEWQAKFFGSLTALLRKEVVGPTPDGLRINWHVVEGTFAGPGFEARVLPGAADWMRIRRDGVAIVSVQACFETATRARVFGSYNGVFDLGPDGYERAMRGEFDPLPPVVVTPSYATADPQLAWLNRAQCLGVGRVDMAALRVEFDVYIAHVGGAVASPGPAGQAGAGTASAGTLYARMGGHDVIAAITDDFLSRAWADPVLGRYFAHGHSLSTKRILRQHVVNLLGELTGGPCFYTGRDMTSSHRGLGITVADWEIAVTLFAAAVDAHRVPAQERKEFLRIIQNLESQIVSVRP